MTNSRQKGKRGELQLAKKFKEYGIEAYRSQQYSGHHQKGDPDLKGTPGLHVEVKWQQKQELEKWLAQAKNDCSSDKLPILSHKRNNEGWKITMDFDTFMSLYREWLESHELGGD